MQNHLLSHIPEAILERRFPEIGRIADVAVPEWRVVFEVQCSPLSVKEAISRIADYRSIGWECIWILHVVQFNRARLSITERHLSPYIFYYTDIQATGEGSVYEEGRLANYRLPRSLLTFDAILQPHDIDKLKDPLLKWWFRWHKSQAFRCIGGDHVHGLLQTTSVLRVHLEDEYKKFYQQYRWSRWLWKKLHC